MLDEGIFGRKSIIAISLTLFLCSYTGWQFGLVVTRWLRSTLLRYVRPG